MYSVDESNLRKGIGFYLAFFIIGFLFIVLAISITIDDYSKKAKTDSSVESISVEIHRNESDDLVSPIYKYVVNGKEYECRNNYSSRNYSTAPKKIYYQSSNPSVCIPEQDKINLGLLLLFLIPSIGIFIGVKGIYGTLQRIKKVRKLATYGKLVKGLVYTLEDTGMKKNGHSIQVPVVNYTLSTGTVLSLKGDPRFDYKVVDGDGCVDLLIDENDPSNYFIDFEIN